jgi:hypothetical protein
MACDATREAHARVGGDFTRDELDELLSAVVAAEGEARREANRTREILATLEAITPSAASVAGLARTVAHYEATERRFQVLGQRVARRCYEALTEATRRAMGERS